MLYRVHLARVGFELTTVVVIGIDCTGSNNFQMSERSYICVLGVSTLCLFCTIFLKDFGTVLTVCYYFVFHSIAVTFSERPW
jgi:hypothetical protein